MSDALYTAIRCRKTGSPKAIEAFQQVANYRGIPFAKIGMRVEVDGEKGLIMGHNSSANFNILFLDGCFKNRVLNCQPNWKMKFYDAKENEILSGG